MKVKKLNKRGFTLIELLIVIIIIGILAAIAFVAYSGAQTKAKQSKAESTVATAKTKLAEYNADNGHYPVDQPTFLTWVASAEGGNNKTFANDFGTDSSGTNYKGFTYVAKTNDTTPASCASDATTCQTYTITGAHESFGGSEDISQTN